MSYYLLNYLVHNSCIQLICGDFLSGDFISPFPVTAVYCKNPSIPCLSGESKVARYRRRVGHVIRGAGIGDFTNTGERIVARYSGGGIGGFTVYIYIFNFLEVFSIIKQEISCLFFMKDTITILLLTWLYYLC